MNLLNLLPKIPLTGSIHIEFKRCGRKSCQCARGLLHGPYTYHRWRHGGKQHKTYIPLSRLSDYLDAQEAFRALFPKALDIRKMGEELSGK